MNRVVQKSDKETIDIVTVKGIKYNFYRFQGFIKEIGKYSEGKSKQEFLLNLGDSTWKK